MTFWSLLLLGFILIPYYMIWKWGIRLFVIVAIKNGAESQVKQVGKAFTGDRGTRKESGTTADPSG